MRMTCPRMSKPRPSCGAKERARPLGARLGRSWNALLLINTTKLMETHQRISIVSRTTFAPEGIHRFAQSRNNLARKIHAFLMPTF